MWIIACDTPKEALQYKFVHDMTFPSKSSVKFLVCNYYNILVASDWVNSVSVVECSYRTYLSSIVCPYPQILVLSSHSYSVKHSSCCCTSWTYYFTRILRRNYKKRHPDCRLPLLIAGILVDELKCRKKLVQEPLKLFALLFDLFPFVLKIAFTVICVDSVFFHYTFLPFHSSTPAAIQTLMVS